MTTIMISLLLGLFWGLVGLAAGLGYGWCVAMFATGAIAGLFGVAMCKAAGKGDDDERD